MMSSRSGLVVGMVIVLTIVAACASSQNASRRLAACPLTPADSAFLRGGPVYRDCAVDSKAKLITNTVRVDYRPSGPVSPGNKCYSVEMQLVVDTEGKPEQGTIEVVRTTDRAYADAVVSSASGWRYEPATLAGARVRQIVTERQAMGTVTVVVPAGQSPTGAARPPRRAGC